MNCPSRNDETIEHEDWNQNPSSLAADLTTREDLNGTVNRRTNQDASKLDEDARTGRQRENAAEHHQMPDTDARSSCNDRPKSRHSISLVQTNTQHSFGERRFSSKSGHSFELFPDLNVSNTRSTAVPIDRSRPAFSVSFPRTEPRCIRAFGQFLKKSLGFVGPGFMVAVAYVDPGNYSTDVSAGVATRFKLLFIVLMSNIFAIVLQSLAIRLGTVTGMNLAEHCRANLPRWLNIALYLLGEGAIIATDIAEVSLSKPIN